MGNITRLVFIATTLLFLASLTIAQNQPGGGRIPSTPSTKTKSETTKSATPKQSGAVDRIDGRWWTTGNDFGASELVLAQDGNNITGEIHYLDGRTGTLTGTFTNKRLKFTFINSSGDRGTGWLELSWINFLGGPWHNATVKDGSWTLNRIESQWCQNGNKGQVLRVTHDVSGRLTIVGADGSQQSGTLEGPYLYLDTPQGRVKGDVFYKSTRINWQNGTFWTWCGR